MKKIIKDNGEPLIINGKKCYLVDHLYEFFITGIPELDKGIENMFNFPESSEEAKKCVYLIGFKDGTIKIGVSGNPERRLNAIKHSSGRTIEDRYISKQIPLKYAFEIETIMKDTLKKYRLEGEFFDIPFKKVKGLLEFRLDEYGFLTP